MNDYLGDSIMNQRWHLVYFQSNLPCKQQRILLCCLSKHAICISIHSLAMNCKNRPASNYWSPMPTAVATTHTYHSSNKQIEFPPLGGSGNNYNIKPSRPIGNRNATAVARIFQVTPTAWVTGLKEIAKLFGERPEFWSKPKFGDFDYWLAQYCGWITKGEPKSATDAFQAKRQFAVFPQSTTILCF